MSSDSGPGTARLAGRERAKPCSADLALAVDDTAFGQVVGGKLDAYAVAGDDPDKVFSHTARDVGHNDVSTFDLDAEARIGERLRDDAFDFECFFLLICHKDPNR